MTDKPFQVIDGLKDQATVVCTWCAATFLTRTALQAHWKSSPRCNRNRTVSNPTQSKYE